MKQDVVALDARYASQRTLSSLALLDERRADYKGGRVMIASAFLTFRLDSPGVGQAVHQRTSARDARDSSKARCSSNLVVSVNRTEAIGSLPVASFFWG